MEIYLVITNTFDQLEGEIRSVESFKDIEEAQEEFNAKLKDYNKEDLESYNQIKYEKAGELIDSVHPKDNDDIISIDLIKIYL